MRRQTGREHFKHYRGYLDTRLSRFTATLSVIMNEWMSCDTAAQTASMAGCLNSLSRCVCGGGHQLSRGEAKRWSTRSERRRRCADDHSLVPIACSVPGDGYIEAPVYPFRVVSRWCVYAPSCCLLQPRCGHKMWGRIRRPGLLPGGTLGIQQFGEIRISNILHFHLI